VDAYVRGVVKSGIGATLKHFPGHPVLEGVPATEDAYVPLSMGELRPYLEPFKAGIAAGAHAVLMGPAVFEATETPTAGSISPELINLLRTDLNFRGLVITCDLDHRATMQDRGISETAIRALLAGADLLLLSPKSVPHLPEIAAAIAASVESGRLPLMRLESAVAAIDRTIAKVAH
jgi:beta-N-acetylhexosaminidase